MTAAPTPATLAQIVAALSVTYTDAGVAAWLNGWQSQLNGRSALEAIRDGLADLVVDAVTRIGDADPRDFCINRGCLA